MKRGSMIWTGVAAAAVAGSILLALVQLGYVFNLNMTTSETERWLLKTHGYGQVQCRHSYTLGFLDWDYHCRVYTVDGSYVWSPSFEVNGHRDTRQTAP